MLRFLNRDKPHTLRAFLLPIIVLLLVLLIFVTYLSSISDKASEKEKESLEKAVNNSVTFCYAIEGFYPEDVAYLEENYNLSYDHEKFAIGYRLQGSNMMPDITIIELEK